MTTAPPLGPTPAPATQALGALLHTDVEHVDLGEHAGRHLRARVERRTLRIALGRSWSTGLTLGRRRATAVEVTPSAGRTSAAERYDVAIPGPVDPWLQTAQRIAAVTVVGWMVVWIAHRLRDRRAREGAPR